MIMQARKRYAIVKTDADGLIAKKQRATARKSFWEEHSYLLLSAGLPALLILLLYFARGHHPIDDGTVLVLDLTAQYVWFFEALRDAVWGDGSLLYSFSRALGGEFIGIYAYYIASPLSYIVCLFPKDRMLEALLCLFTLKTAISGATFGFYMHKTMRERSKLSIIIFSCCYALCTYAIVHQHNTMWIDALMWLPLLTYGIERLIKKGRFKLYTIMLALTVFSNFYIGYMVCFYCFIYFFLYYFAHNEEGRNNLLGEKLHFVKSLLRIAIFSLLAIGIAAVILLGAYYSLNFGKTTFSNTQYEWATNFDLLEFLYKFLPGSYDTVRPEGLPFVYCGLITLLFIPAYFLSKKYSIREKIFGGILIFLLVASFSLTVVDLIWHGFQAPNWLNYRYSFMLCFYLCVIACRGFADFKNVSLKVLMGCGGLIALLCVILQKFTDGEYVTPHDYTCIWFTLIAVFVYLAVLGLLRTSDNKKAIALVLVSVVCAELFLNALFTTIALDYDVTYSHYSYYNNFLDSTRPLTDKIQEEDTSFYRMEKTSWRAINDNMALTMRGLTGSTSTLNKETIQFLQKMGYASKSHWSKYLGGTPVNDSLLGVKYILSKNAIYGNYYDVYATDATHGYTAYKNPYALPIGYAVNDAVLKFPLGFTNTVSDDKPTNKDEDEPLIDLNAIGGFVSGIKGKLNTWLDIDETINSSEYVDEYHNPFDRVNAMIAAMLGEEANHVYTPLFSKASPNKNIKMYSTADHRKYERIDENKKAIVTYETEVEADGEVYFYLPTRYLREVELELTNFTTGEVIEIGSCNGNETNRIISLGYHHKGDQLSLEVLLKGSSVYVMNGQKLFWQIDWAVFEDTFAKLASSPLEITEYTEDHLTGTFKASEEHQLLMTTIAYDKGWKILVDGKEVESVKTFGSLLGFYVDGAAGTSHSIELIYRPNTLIIGGAISLISLGIFAIISVGDAIARRRKRRREMRPATVGAPTSARCERQHRPTASKTISSKGVASNYVSLYQRNAGASGKRDRRR